MTFATCEALQLLQAVLEAICHIHSRRHQEDGVLVAMQAAWPRV